MEPSLMEFKAQDLNCDYDTLFKVENNQLMIQTVDDDCNPVEIKLSEADSRNLAKWLVHALNYRS